MKFFEYFAQAFTSDNSGKLWHIKDNVDIKSQIDVLISKIINDEIDDVKLGEAVKESAKLNPNLPKQATFEIIKEMLAKEAKRQLPPKPHTGEPEFDIDEFFDHKLYGQSFEQLSEAKKDGFDFKSPTEESQAEMSGIFDGSMLPDGIDLVSQRSISLGSSISSENSFDEADISLIDGRIDIPAIMSDKAFATVAGRVPKANKNEMKNLDGYLQQIEALGDGISGLTKVDDINSVFDKVFNIGKYQVNSALTERMQRAYELSNSAEVISGRVKLDKDDKKYLEIYKQQKFGDGLGVANMRAGLESYKRANDIYQGHTFIGRFFGRFTGRTQREEKAIAHMEEIFKVNGIDKEELMSMTTTSERIKSEVERFREEGKLTKAGNRVERFNRTVNKKDSNKITAQSELTEDLNTKLNQSLTADTSTLTRTSTTFQKNRELNH